MRDHRRNVMLPLHLQISGSSELDDTFVEVPISDLPVNPILSFTLEEWTELERVSGRARAASSASIGEQQGTVVVPFNFKFPAPDFCLSLTQLILSNRYWHIWRCSVS
jgi:hypothetical protein